MSEYLFCLVYVDGWDWDANEPLSGGRCVGVYDTMDAARHAHDAYRLAAPLMWGPGHLLVTDDQGDPVYHPTLPRPVLKIAGTVPALALYGE